MFGALIALRVLCTEAPILACGRARLRFAPMVFTFGLEWCSASLRNAVQLGRNPQVVSGRRRSHRQWPGLARFYTWRRGPWQSGDERNRVDSETRRRIH